MHKHGAGLPDSSRHAKAKMTAGVCLMSPAARQTNYDGVRMFPRSLRGNIAARSLGAASLEGAAETAVGYNLQPQRRINTFSVHE